MKSTKPTESLRNAISQSKLSILELAEQSGVSTQQLYRFLNGKRDLTLSSVDKLANVLGLSLAAERKQ